MVKPEQIPDEVVKAARKAFFSDNKSMAEAIAAARAAWPSGERIYRSEDERLFTIILPLPQEGDA